jgi:PIN domain nuclease of toxin-antitoxin system
MRFLPDTSIILWSVAEEYKLNSHARELLSSKASDLYLSSATAWEIAIKYGLGTLRLHAEPAVFIPEVIRGMELRALDITPAHAIEAGRLPRHHRDPFDRMLIAQAQMEGLVLLTADRVFEKYKVEQIFCGK